jgi:ABC-2 type transport system permease protein
VSALAYTVTDSVTMLRRNLRRLRRYPSMTLLLVGMPIVFLLLFVYVFGGQLGAGLGRGLAGGHAGRAGYLNYVTPGILLMTVAAAVQGTAIVVAMDMTGGIIDRFRTMAIARACVLTGHVLASLIQTLVSILVVLGVAVVVGFRPTADAASWLAAIGVLVLFALALIWLATALGLAAKSVETASNTPMFLTLLPFLGSGFVPTASMPAGLRQFATYQPFTPVTETLRGLLTGTHIGGNAIGAIAWSVGTSTSNATPAEPAEGKQLLSGRSVAVESRAGRCGVRQLLALI